MRQAHVLDGKAETVTIAGYDRVLSFLKGPWPVLILLGLFWWMAVSAQLEKSPTFDEIPHLTGGYTSWVANDYRLVPESGNLPQRWVAIPLLFGQYNLPLNDLPAWKNAEVYTAGYSFFYSLANDPGVMLISGRAMMASMAVGLGALVYCWSRTLFGPFGGLLSLCLFIFCPNMLAHGSLMTTDLPLSLFLTASAWSIWAMLQHVTARTIILSALSIAAALLSKLSSLALVPIALLLFLIQLLARRPLKVSIFGEFYARSLTSKLAWLALVVALQTLVVLTIFWSFYGFRYSAFAPVQGEGGRFARSWEQVLGTAGSWTPVIQFAQDHHLLPEAYLYGFAFGLTQNTSRQAFLNGEYREEGWWYFFPYTMLVKTPLPLFILLAVAGAGAAVKTRNLVGKTAFPSAACAKTWYATIPLWVLLVVYWGFALTSQLNIGHRHILPTYPPMFVLAGAAAVWFRLPYRVMQVVVLTSLGWFALESLTIRPHYLAYFNQIAGGPAHAYRHLVDSSLDWGQDLPGLRRWLGQHREETDQDQSPLLLAYFGMGNPKYYGINARLLPSFPAKFRNASQEALNPLTGGTYCVSATTLQGLHGPYWGPWTDSYEQTYLELVNEVNGYAQLHGNPARTRDWIEEHGGQVVWEQLLEMFNDLRAARLLAYLRKREPDDQVGYSILIYRLTDEQVRVALEGPAPS